MDVGTVIGGVAGVCTTLSSVPQLKKCWENRIGRRLVASHAASS